MTGRIALVAVAAMLATLSISQAAAQPVRGTFTAVVDFAQDPGQAAFGLDPNEWIGKEVKGTFEYDVAASSAQEFLFPDGVVAYTVGSFVPTRWLRVTASIEGREFSTPDGEVLHNSSVSIRDNDGPGTGDGYIIQDSVFPRSGGLRELVLVFGGDSGLFSYQPGGTGVPSFNRDTCAAGVDGFGAIIVDNGPGAYSSIGFRYTSLCLGRTPEQIFDDLDDKTRGVGPRSINNGVRNARAYYEANDIESAGLQIEEAENQVGVFMRAPQANPNRIESAPGNEILSDFAELKEAIGYEPN